MGDVSNVKLHTGQEAWDACASKKDQAKVDCIANIYSDDVQLLRKEVADLDEQCPEIKTGKTKPNYHANKWYKTVEIVTNALFGPLEACRQKIAGGNNAPAAGDTKLTDGAKDDASASTVTSSADTLKSSTFDARVNGAIVKCADKKTGAFNLPKMTLSGDVKIDYARLIVWLYANARFSPKVGNDAGSEAAAVDKILGETVAGNAATLDQLMSDPKRSDGEKLFYIISVYAQVAYRSGLKDDASEPKDYEIYQGMFEAVIGMIANQNKVEPNEIYDQWKSASELEAPWTYGEDAEAAKAAVESLIVFYLRMPSK